MKKLRVALLVTLLIPLTSSAAGYFYRVQREDTLSDVLYRLNAKPIYGKNGTLASVVQFNPKKLLDGANHLYPREKIYLPKEMVDELSGAQVLPTGEVIALAPENENRSFLEGAATPAPIATLRDVAEDSDSDVRSDLSFGIGAQYFRIDAQDRTTLDHSTILSNLSPSLELGWKLIWSKSVSFLFSGNFARYNLQPLASLSFDHSTGTLTNLNFQMDYKISESLGGWVGAAARDQLFLHSSDLTTLSVDEVKIFSPEIGLRYDLFTKRAANIGIFGQYDFLMPTSTSFYDVKSGHRATVGLYFRHDAKDGMHGLECDLSYGMENQDTSIMNLSEKDFLLDFKYHFNLDW